MRPWLGLINAYATAILHILNLQKEHATRMVNASSQTFLLVWYFAIYYGIKPKEISDCGS